MGLSCAGLGWWRGVDWHALARAWDGLGKGVCRAGWAECWAVMCQVRPRTVENC